MATSSQNFSGVLVFSFLLFLPTCLGVTCHAKTANLTYHGGPLLTGNLRLGFIWYGQVGRKYKTGLRAFVKSLNQGGAAKLQPQVSQWWDVVEGFQEAAGKDKSPIKVHVVKQVTDASYSMGHVITSEYVKPLIEKAGNGVIPVIFAAKDVSVEGLCMGKCAVHGISDNNQTYTIVGNPEIECPSAYGWLFYQPDKGAGEALKPPNGNTALDAMLVAFAQGLAELVANPLNTGFYQDEIRDPIEASIACKGVFGSGAAPGSTRKMNTDQATGAAFNAYGSKGKRFLLPAVWNPKTKSCFTLM